MQIGVGPVEGRQHLLIGHARKPAAICVAKPVRVLLDQPPVIGAAQQRQIDQHAQAVLVRRRQQIAQIVGSTKGWIKRLEIADGIRVARCIPIAIPQPAGWVSEVPDRQQAQCIYAQRAEIGQRSRQPGKAAKLGGVNFEDHSIARPQGRLFERAHAAQRPCALKCGQRGRPRLAQQQNVLRAARHSDLAAQPIRYRDLVR